LLMTRTTMEDDWQRSESGLSRPHSVRGTVNHFPLVPEVFAIRAQCGREVRAPSTRHSLQWIMMNERWRISFLLTAPAHFSSQHIPNATAHSSKGGSRSRRRYALATGKRVSALAGR